MFEFLLFSLPYCKPVPSVTGTPLFSHIEHSHNVLLVASFMLSADSSSLFIEEEAVLLLFSFCFPVPSAAGSHTA